MSQPTTPLSISAATDIRSPSSSSTYNSSNNSTPERNTQQAFFASSVVETKELKELFERSTKSIQDIESVMIEFRDNKILLQDELKKQNVSPEAITDINAHVRQYYQCEASYAGFLRAVDAAITQFKIVLTNFKRNNTPAGDLSKEFGKISALNESACKLQQQLLHLLPDIMTLKKKYGFELSVQVKKITGLSTLQMAVTAIGIGLATGAVGSMALPVSIAGWMGAGFGGLSGAAATALSIVGTHRTISEEDMITQMEQTVDDMQHNLREFQDRFGKISGYEGAHQTTPLQPDQIDELLAITEVILNLVAHGQGILNTSGHRATVNGKRL